MNKQYLIMHADDELMHGHKYIEKIPYKNGYRYVYNKPSKDRSRSVLGNTLNYMGEKAKTMYKNPSDKWGNEYVKGTPEYVVNNEANREKERKADMDKIAALTTQYNKYQKEAKDLRDISKKRNEKAYEIHREVLYNSGVVNSLYRDAPSSFKEIFDIETKKDSIGGPTPVTIKLKRKEGHAFDTLSDEDRDLIHEINTYISLARKSDKEQYEASDEATTAAIAATKKEIVMKKCQDEITQIRRKYNGTR